MVLPGRNSILSWARSHWLLLLSLCLLASALAAANLHPRQLPSDGVQRAHILHAAGHTYEAYCLFESALAKEPENFNLLYSILEMGREGDTISHLVQSRLDALKEAPKTRVRAQLLEAYALAVVKKDYREALQRLETLPPSEKGLGIIRALALGGLGKDDEALACWRQERSRGTILGADYDFCLFCQQRGYLVELRSLCDDPKTSLPQAHLNHFKAWVAARDGHYLDYCWAKLKRLALTGPGAVLAAFLIAATWMLVLSKGRPAGPMLAAFSLGVMAALFLMGPLHGLLWRADRLLSENSLGYLFTHVGLVEELVKLAPLPLLWSLGKMREPADWVVYGCLSGLGFATEENLHYFNEPYFDRSLWRFLLCVPGHMFFTALIGYAWGRSVPLRPSYRVLACLTTWILMSFWHALYDYAEPYQAIGLLEALCLGRLLQTIAGINLPRGLSHSVLPCALALLALTYWQIHLSLDTDLANDSLACNVAVLFLLPAFFYTLESSNTKAGHPRIRLALHLLALSGSCLILTQALPSPLCLWMLPGAGLLALVILSVHFGGAYALWLRQPGPAPSSCELDSLDFTATSVGAQGTEKTHHWTQRRIWLLWSLLLSVVQLAVVAACAISGCTEWSFDWADPIGTVALWLLLALLNWCLIGPLTHLSPILLGAWIHDHHDTCALVFQRGLLKHRGGVVLWSPLADGHWVTTADAAPWTVYPRGTYLQLCRGMDIPQLLERHLAGLAAYATPPLHLDAENLDSQFQAYLDRAQSRFLAAPLTTTLESCWETVLWYGLGRGASRCNDGGSPGGAQ